MMLELIQAGIPHTAITRTCDGAGTVTHPAEVTMTVAYSGDDDLGQQWWDGTIYDGEDETTESWASEQAAVRAVADWYLR
jgi:hypothetical protein